MNALARYPLAARLLRRVHPRARTAGFWAAVLLTAAVVGSATAYLRLNYLVGFSAEAEQSVGSAWTLVRLDPGAVKVGGYGAFTTDARVKVFPPGTRFVKLIVGGPGDLVVIGADKTTVNGAVVAGPLDSASRLHLKPQDLERTILLGPGDYFAVGTRPHSYDSRYWGVVHASQFIGTARLL